MFPTEEWNTHVDKTFHAQLLLLLPFFPFFVLVLQCYGGGGLLHQLHITKLSPSGRNITNIWEEPAKEIQNKSISCLMSTHSVTITMVLNEEDLQWVHIAAAVQAPLNGLMITSN